MILDVRASMSLMIGREGGGYDFEGYDVYFLATTNIIVARNSVKYVLHTQIHTPRGHKGTKNQCLWKGPKG